MMMKWCLLFFLLLSITVSCAQKKESVYDRYLDYNLARFERRSAQAFEMGKDLLDSAGNLPANTRIAFYNSMAKLYEDNNQPDNAIFYDEKVVVAAPDYYVAQRALGYLYLETVNELQAKLDAAPENTPEYRTLQASYKAAALKALPHLEKAQACDPSAETLAIIRKLYTQIADAEALRTLNTRLANLGKNCLDILSDVP
jgi:hypothetical protein